VHDDEVPERDADEQPGGPAVTDPDAPDEPEQPDEPKAARDGAVSLEEHRRRSGRSVSTRAETGDEHPEEDEDGQLEMFVWEKGKKVTLGNLISRGTKVEYAFVFGGKRLKGNGQLIGMEEDVFMLSRGKMGHTKLVPTRKDDETVDMVTVEVQIVPKVLKNADSDEALEMLRPILEARGWEKKVAPDAAEG
jgi:hypothetical protein